jgi:hypothetical protein
MKLKYLLTTLLCALLVLAVPAWAQQPEHRTDASLRAEAAVQVSASLLAPLAGEDRGVRVASGQGTVLDVIDIADILVR